MLCVEGDEADVARIGCSLATQRATSNAEVKLVCSTDAYWLARNGNLRDLFIFCAALHRLCARTSPRVDISGRCDLQALRCVHVFSETRRLLLPVLTVSLR